MYTHEKQKQKRNERDEQTLWSIFQPFHFITHNSLPFFINYFALGEDLRLFLEKTTIMSSDEINFKCSVPSLWVAVKSLFAWKVKSNEQKNIIIKF